MRFGPKYISFVACYSLLCFVFFFSLSLSLSLLLRLSLSLSMYFCQEHQNLLHAPGLRTTCFMVSRQGTESWIATFGRNSRWTGGTAEKEGLWFIQTNTAGGGFLVRRTWAILHLNSLRFHHHLRMQTIGRSKKGVIKHLCCICLTNLAFSILWNETAKRG